MTGGLSALGAALYGIGIPKDSVIKYETAIQADGFVVMAHGSAEDVVRAKAIPDRSNPLSLDLHSSTPAIPAAP